MINKTLFNCSRSLLERKDPNANERKRIEGQGLLMKEVKGEDKKLHIT